MRLFQPRHADGVAGSVGAKVRMVQALLRTGRAACKSKSKLTRNLIKSYALASQDSLLYKRFRLFLMALSTGLSLAKTLVFKIMRLAPQAQGIWRGGRWRYAGSIAPVRHISLAKTFVFKIMRFAPQAQGIVKA